jgi:putative endopeptidase
MKFSTLRFAASIAPAVAAFAVAGWAFALTPAAPPQDGAEQRDSFAGLDRSVTPGDDFFGYANGAWFKATEIPPDVAAWGSGPALVEETNKRVRALLDQAMADNAPVGSEVRKVADYYATFMDEAAIEARGSAPLKPALDRIAAVKDKSGLARLLGEDLRADVDPLNMTHFHTERLFGLWVSPDWNAPKQHIAYLLQGGLGLPDREFYLADTPRMVEVRKGYQAQIAAMFKLAGITDGEARAARIMGLETKLARAHASRAESEDVRKANNKWPRGEFGTRAPGLAWDVFFRAAGLDKAAALIVWHAGAVKGMAGLVGSEPIEVWRDWLSYHAIEQRSAMLSKAFVDQHFAFFGKTLSGTPQLADRWKRGVRATNYAIGEGVAKLYVKKYFPAAYKAQVQAMVDNIRAAFAARIDKLTWMTPATRTRAKETLGTLYFGVGYPETWIDYAGLSIVRGDAVGNFERAEAFEYRRNLAKLDKPVDNATWAMLPHVVNAINLPIQNAINFPAAILQPPYFDPSAPAAANYGAIGATIGHEISHSFDDQGAQFDAQGKLADWWTKEDRAHFEAAGRALARQFDAYKPFPDLHVNGTLTLSENIADLAGLSAAHDGWLRSLGGKPAKVVQGLTGEQQFFLAYAQSWRTKMREPLLRQLIITDGHAPAQYRALIVRNLDGWYTAFGIKPGQSLYLAPKDRVQVW